VISTNLIQESWRAVVAFISALCFAVAAPAEEAKTLKGVALVIGQSKYAHITPLTNPANDAREMVKLLSDMGFDARGVTDRDAVKLSRDLERRTVSAPASGPGSSRRAKPLPVS